ncbi:Gic1p KNAG_0B04600 [Huiozyma naganishii CBS 8797]|uniref:CRIB domain-containing protein n=1 Tax=Huiozyma naganishii (strain ATCC MYA-139 / BCRC 22969 / CBS 8797 / KCTC 17520 / NBRC 10181 / NCYC 3082 / Yp74L-3) TaxID=1071383 RepID=J7S3T4_HUIN7|nr:hypothetical protein KNAG_0B04600 [Kazachstania naganishii CBS 8797]CCK68894.1 hypothetical protein KNAG_0B04600 [Kazachstania naganishii CBS 8797]
MNQQLPQIKSIWIDEDEEAEKLYGLQTQQFMGSDSDEELNITMVNSKKLALDNKKKIALPPLASATNLQRNSNVKSTHYDMSSGSSSRGKPSKKSLLKFFKGNSSESSGKKQRSISAPFNFHHISHAGGKAEVINDIPTFKDARKMQEAPQEQSQTEASTISRNSSRKSKEVISLSKAFVTESPYYPTSSTSSVYSSMHSNHDRIMSISTSATTCMERTPSFSTNRPASPLNKPYFIQKHDSYDSTELSADFLKQYSFPTLLEDEPVEDFRKHDEGKEKIEALKIRNTDSEKFDKLLATVGKDIHERPQSISSKTQSPEKGSIERRSFSTPELEQYLFANGSSKEKITVEDILRYYNPSNSEHSSPYI